jgi:AP-2 complex subunit alpha
LFQALALSAVANIGGREMADALAPSALKLLRDESTRPFVLKRAALCLLRLYRKFPEILEHEKLVPHIIRLLA